MTMTINDRIRTRAKQTSAPVPTKASELDSLYVLGGQQRSPRSLLDHDRQWYNYQQGIILQVNTETGASDASTIEPLVEYVSPPEVCAPGDPMLFKAGTVQDKKLYVCTQTEIVIYSLPDFTQIHHLSLPFFNDVHHVRPTPEGNLLVVISGLDLIVEMTMSGEVLQEWDVYDGKPWTRFPKQLDYRKGISTKPHKSHPNFVFYVDDEIWVTRFEQKDAVCLNRPDRRIDIGIERVHDGYFHDGYLYFTTVNGTIVIANPMTLQIEQVIDLTALHDTDLPLGWCRGILLEDTKAWVGFSRIRPTRFREAVSWLRLGFKYSRPTHIACYDLAERKCLTEIEVEEHGLNAVFSIFPGPAG